jgi:hypothetical protein
MAFITRPNECGNIEGLDAMRQQGNAFQMRAMADWLTAAASVIQRVLQ